MPGHLLLCTCPSASICGVLPSSDSCAPMAAHDTALAAPTAPAACADDVSRSWLRAWAGLASWTLTGAWRCTPMGRPCSGATGCALRCLYLSTMSCKMSCFGGGASYHGRSSRDALIHQQLPVPRLNGKRVAQDLTAPYAAFVFYTMQLVIDYQISQLEGLGVVNASTAPQASCS